MELTPWIWQQFTDSDGSALSAGKIYTYFSGTTVKATTYQDALGTTPNTNPIILEADGFAPGGQIFLPVGVVYSFLVTDSLGGTVKTIDDIEAKSAGTVTTDYTVMVDGSDPMPAYLGLKLSAGSNVTITPVTGGPNGTVLEIASTGGGGVTQWEVVTLGGADYLTPITGLPQKLYASDAMMAEKTVTAGAYRGLTARENYVRMDGENGTLGLNQSVTGSTNTGLFFGVNDSTQRAKIQATKNIGDPAKVEISALMTGTKTSSGWLALDADNCLTLATPSPSDVGAQPASTNLGSIASLADAVGWLKNSGTGVFSYTTPTAADVGAIPVGGAVLSVTASGTSIAVGGTPTNPTVALNLGNSNAWSAKQTISVPAGGNFALELDGYASLVNGYWNVTSTPGGVAVIAQTAYAGSSDVIAYYNTSTDASAAVGFRGLLNYGAGSITAWNVVTSKLSSAAVTNFKQRNAAGTLVDVATWTGATDIALPQTSLTWSGNPTHSGNHTFSGNLTVNGNITATARLASNLDPDATNTRSLGQDTLRYAGVYATEFYRAGVALGTTLGNYLPLAGGTISNNLQVNGTLTVGTTTNLNGPTNIGDALTDSISFGGRITSNLIIGTTASVKAPTVAHASAAGAYVWNAVGSYYNGIGSHDTTTNSKNVRLGTVVADGTNAWQGQYCNLFLENITANGLAGTGTRMVTASSTGGLSASGGNYRVPLVKTVDYTLLATDDVVILTGTTGRTLTLPDATGSGQTYTLCNECTGGALLTIGLNTGDTINATTGWTVPQNQSITVCDYADEKWVIL